MAQYGLIGEKLVHSFSKILHNRMDNPEYDLMEISRDDIEEYLKKADFSGINVTIPYKENALRSCMADETAKAIGSVNTLVKREGVVYGYNTDCLGFHFMMESAGIRVKGKKVAILGSGGTSKTALYQCYRDGAAEIVVVSRRSGCDYPNSVDQNKCRVSFVTYEDCIAYSDAQVLVNTTPVGMFPNVDVTPVSLDVFNRLEGVADVIYNPLTTKLVSEAAAKNIPGTNGLSMLVSQAVYAERYFFPERFPDETTVSDTVKRLWKEIFREKQSIILVGMPGAGKSSTGKELAARMGREFYDTDDLFTVENIMNPGEYITLHGEKAFRDAESETVRNVCSKSGIVLATGGGSILRPENVSAMKSNGVIVYLRRDLSELSSEGRPLSVKNGVAELFRQRKAIYESVSDFTVDVNSDLAVTIVNLERELENYYNHCS